MRTQARSKETMPSVSSCYNLKNGFLTILLLHNTVKKSIVSSILRGQFLKQKSKTISIKHHRNSQRHSAFISAIFGRDYIHVLIEVDIKAAQKVQSFEGHETRSNASLLLNRFHVPVSSAARCMLGTLAKV